MAKRIMLLALCLMLLATAGAKGEDSGVCMIVATDLHYLASELTDGGAFFRNLIEKSDGKVMAYSEELIDAFVQQVIDEKPDVLVLSGDLTYNGERVSHEALACKLALVEQAGIPVLVIPGNHDMNNRSAVRFEGEGYIRVDSVTVEEFRTIYHAFGYDEAIAQDSASLSYVAQVSPQLRLLMVDASSRYSWGEVPRETLPWIREQLEQAQRDGCHVIAVSHQNLLSHNERYSTGYRINNFDQLCKMYDSASVLCNLSGHIHMQHISQNRMGLWDIATSSLAVTPNQYGVLQLSGEELFYHTRSVDVSAWARAQGRQEPELLQFAAYSEDFFKTNAYRQGLRAASEDEHPQQLAAFFAEINTAYFSGRMDLFAMDEELLERWKLQPASLANYIVSISAEEPRNYCEWHLTYGENP